MTKTENFIASGPKLQVEGVDELIGDLLFRSMKKLPMDKVFQIVVEPYEKITIGEFFKLSAQICESLIKQGLKKGDVVTLIGNNSSKLHASFIGAIWAGGIPNPISGSCKTTCGNVTRLEDILQDIDLGGFSPKRGGKSEDVAVILCSSGTTGVPKGVALSHSALMNTFLKWQYMPRVEFSCSQIITSSFAWVTGVLFLLISCMHGSDRVVTHTNDPETLLQIIEKYKVKGILIPPPLLSRMLDSPNFTKYDVSSIREVYTGGSILARHTAIKFTEIWKTSSLHLLYGMTEAGFISMPSVNQPYESSGVPFYDTKLKIVDVDSGKVLGPNQMGEIYITTSGMFTEYVGDEEATRDTLVDGWIRTGDLGYLDENGNIFIRSRLKEIFKCDNYQISPVEIEAFISSLPGVDDVGVVGIPTDPYSVILMALVVKGPGAAITAEDIEKSVADNLSEKKHLKAVYFVDECPRSPSRKLRRNILFEMAMNFYNNTQNDK